jgi:hypothetical protein
MSQTQGSVILKEVLPTVILRAITIGLWHDPKNLGQTRVRHRIRAKVERRFFGR